MIKYLKEFSNTGKTGNSFGTNSKVDALTLAKKYNFSTDDASTEGGILIAPNNMIAVDFDLIKKNIVIRPDNDLELGTKDLALFKQDLAACEKLATEIARLK